MRIKIISVLFVALLVSPGAHAFDGKVYFGRFFNQTYRAAPTIPINAEWVGGVEVGHKIDIFRLRPWARIETLMDEWGDTGWHPASVRYSAGITYFLPYNMEIEYSHMCWHPVDRLAYGDWSVEEYDLIMFTIRF